MVHEPTGLQAATEPLHPPRPWRQLDVKELRAITQKGVGEIFLVSQYVYRPLTIYVTRVYALLGLGANAATLHSLLLALAGAVAVLFPGPDTFLFAAICLQGYFILDHVDGELARLTAWRLGTRPTFDGEYFDFWVHFHSMNLFFGAAGVGLALATGNLVWAIAGLIADNCLGNFPKFTLAWVLWTLYGRDPEIIRSPHFKAVLEILTGVEQKQRFAGTLNTRQKAKLLAMEVLVFPGCLIVLTATLLADAGIGLFGGQFSGVVTGWYILLFASLSVVSKVSRSVISARQLRALTPPAVVEAMGP